MARDGAASEIEAAVREVEAFIADRKIRDGGPAQCEPQAGPVVERRVGDLVAPEAPGRAGERDVANLAAPAFDERDCERVGRGRREFVANPAVRRGAELLP